MTLCDGHGADSFGRPDVGPSHEGAEGLPGNGSLPLWGRAGVGPSGSAPRGGRGSLPGRLPPLAWEKDSPAA